MLNKITTLIFSSTILCSAFGFSDLQDEYEKIAHAYDEKTTNDSNLNFKLAKDDYIFFNHNGLVGHGDSIDVYISKIKKEEDFLELIHKLEKNTVYLALPYLGTPKESDLILDAGCGAGGCSLLIHQAFGCHIEGITLSKEQANFANSSAYFSNCHKNVKFFQGNMLKLDKKENYYDIIWVCESSEHVKDLSAMFQEFQRVSKSKSRLVLIAWCANDPQLKETVDRHYLTHIHTADEYIQKAKNSGWQLLYQEDLTQKTAKYWQIRALSKNATGAEVFMEPGFSNNDIQYFLFTFQNNKESL